MAVSGTITRIGTALVLLPLTLALIWIEPLEIGFVLFIVVLAAIGMHEYLRIAAAKGAAAEETVVIPCGAAIVFSAMWGNPALVAIIFLGGFFVCVTVHLKGAKGSLARVPAAVFGLVYLGWIPAHMVLLHALPGQGPALVMVVLVAVVLTDAGAYFLGRSLGKHRLAPVVSPKKTWEGAIGGFVLAVLGVMAYAYVNHQWNELNWSAGFAALVGVLLSIAAQVGDLAKSALKRDAGVKDSGTIFPGHGGVLDRCDGFLFATPVLYYIVTF